MIPMNDEWYIRVEPVSRALRHQVKDLLNKEAFPRIRHWLLENKNLRSRHGAQWIEVLFDEGTEKLTISTDYTHGETFTT
jgi:hypothetical protein